MPLPTDMVKQRLDTLLTVITGTIKPSLSESTVPSKFKEDVFRLLLKKPGLDKILSNCRSMSDLSLVLKILEKVVAKR